MAFETASKSPPLVFVLSEEGIQIVMFPFCDSDGDDLVEAVLIPLYPFWVNDDGQSMMNTELFVLLIMLAGRQKVHPAEHELQIVYTYPNATKKRVIRKFIQTVKQEMHDMEQRLAQAIAEAIAEKQQAEQNLAMALQRIRELEKELQDEVCDLPHFSIVLCWSFNPLPPGACAEINYERS